MFHKGKHDREKQLRFSIRKVSFGAASVAVAALFMFLGNGAVSAAEQGVPSTNGETQAQQPKDQNAQNGTYEGNTVATNPAATVETNTQPSKVENSPSPESAPQKVETLDKKELTDLIKEIDGKFAKGTYATKTEESVNNLRTILDESRTVLSTATTQTELTVAYRQLITATSKLQTKSEKKKEQAVDNPSDKGSEGKKNASTEKTLQSNSIANSGSRDERNGKALDANNPFRTDAATTDTDPTANQTYTAPAADANLETLSNELKNLPNIIENNKKVQDMDTLGNALNVEKGSVKEINEFGGWKAVGDNGKFAIARKTEAGVFPIETVNTVWADSTKSYVTWVLEQSFNRDSDYMLFLSKVRTKASSTEEAYDNSTYVSTGQGNKIAKGVKGFDGIQKTFKAYSKEHGSKVIVSFRTGYTGDIDGTKAQYKVEVIINRNGQEEKLYNQTFTPEVSKTNTEMTVVKASDGKNSPQSFSTPGTPLPTKAELEAKIANNKPNGTGGTFKSKEIELPEGVTEYTVRISSADNLHLGMGYQSPYRHYALPVTGSDFNVDQDTGTIAKDLLSRIYDKLKATESADTDGKTNETKAAYLAELENIKTLVTSTDVKKTVEYKEALEAILSKQLALKVDKTVLKNAKEALNTLATEADPTTGKTADSAKTYNDAKTAAQEAIQAAQTVIDNTDATVAQVKEALNKVNEKKAALEAAKQALVEAVTPVGKEKALEAIQTASEAKIASIDKNAKLSDDEKAAAKAEVAQAAIAAVNAINEAKDQDGVDAAQTTGTTAINAVNPVGKEKALEAIQTASEAKIASIDKNAKLSDDEKAAAKAEVAKAAIAAVNAINEAKDQDGVDAAQTTGTTAINAVNPVGKEKALEAIQTASEAKIASIDKNAKLSDDEKAAAKAEVAQAAIAAVNAINEAKDQEGVDGAQTTGVKAIEAVTPVGTSSTVGEGNVITPPTVEVPEYTDPVGTSSTDGAGNLITPPTVEVPAYTEPVGTSSTDGAGNLITPPTAEVPAYTEPVGTSSTDGAGNLITPPTAEVPAYTDPVGTSSTDGEGNVITPPTVEVPAYTDPVGTSNTDGDGNVITPPTVEVPAYTDPVGTSSTDGAGNVITPPTAEVPAYTEPVGTSSTSGDGNVVTPPTAEVPAYTGSVNGISEEMPAQPHKDGSANEMSDGTPGSETTINKDRQLPNTGTADSTVAMVAAAASAVLGLGLAGRRRKEDEEA